MAEELKKSEEKPEYPDKVAIAKTGYFQPGGLFQVWAVGSHLDVPGPEVWTTNFRIRRAEIKAKGEIIPKTFGWAFMVDAARLLDFQSTTVEVENQGYLPTYILSSAKRLEWNEPLLAEVTTEGCQRVSPAAPRVEVGHLDGWGRGRFSGSQALYYTRSRGNTSTSRFDVMVRGTGSVRVRVGACRVGWIERQIDV